MSVDMILADESIKLMNELMRRMEDDNKTQNEVLESDPMFAREVFVVCGIGCE